MVSIVKNFDFKSSPAQSDNQKLQSILCLNSKTKKKKRRKLSGLWVAAKAKKPLDQALVSVVTSWVRWSILFILRNYNVDLRGIVM